jgi:hypothetical protein
MPPLPLMILDAIADDAETIYTMRNRGEMEPDGIALVGEAHLLDALRSLLADGLVEVETEYVVIDQQLVNRPLVSQPGSSDDDLRRYWFRPTPAGTEAWEAAESELDSYWRAHPARPLR